MNKQAPSYLIGIDLGTTHTVVAYASINDPEKSIHLFEIPQLIAPGEVAPKPLLPSIRYHPAQGEIKSDENFLAPADGAVLGEAARLLGSKSQGRLVTSAKSWLSHNDIDQSAAILPWGSADSVNKISPLDASASYLAHVRTAWDIRFPNAPMAKQNIVVTIPASFDESARALTVEAAKRAGLASIRLLEEPQAVCYDWLRRHTDNLASSLAGSRLLLVCDVGGGTTDLTLIQIQYGSNEPKLTRIAVGDHLMLGGDNIDLALAHLAESRLRDGGKKLSTAELSQLLEQCRIAKERLLAEDAPAQMPVTLLGSGSKLIGASRSTNLTQDEVKQIALEGFLPLSDLSDVPSKKRSGVVEFGLPYAADPAISKHIAAFLHLHASAAHKALQPQLEATVTEHNNDIVPDALLLNGGMFRSREMANRIALLLDKWRGGRPPRLLENRHPDLAVAYGAVSYALARQNKQLKIGGGAARNYFLVLENDNDKIRQGICLLAKGSNEGQEILLPEQQFALRVGQPVRFHLLSDNGEGMHQPGDIVDLDDDHLHELPPLAVVFEEANESEIAVQLLATYTEIGTLRLQCAAVEDINNRWDVEFPIRHPAKQAVQTDLPASFSQAQEKISAIFGPKSKQIDPQAIKALRNDLEKLLSAPRDEWSIPVIRALFDTLLAGRKYRRRSQHHERVWLNLAGFCLRPGMGYPLDDWRIQQLWQIYPEGLQFVNEKQNWCEWWTLWRRVAGGLPQEAQQKIFADIRKFIDPSSARQPSINKQLAIRGYEDIIRLAACLERLPAGDKIQLGEWLLKRLQKTTEPEQSWWALGRVGGRVLLHGNQQDVISAETVTIWLEQILQADWKKQAQASLAATLLARCSADRLLNIDETVRLAVLNKLKDNKAPASWLEMVTEFVPLNAQQENQIFGENLPPGLRLI